MSSDNWYAFAIVLILAFFLGNAIHSFHSRYQPHRPAHSDANCWSVAEDGILQEDSGKPFEEEMNTICE